MMKSYKYMGLDYALELLELSKYIPIPQCDIDSANKTIEIHNKIEKNKALKMLK